MKRIQLSDNFTMSRILLFSLPSIGMQIVDNTYQVADGFFISRFIGEAPFEAENLIFPPLLIIAYVGLMFGTGASALISRELGENRKERACRLLSMVIGTLFFAGIVLSAAFYLLLPDIARWIGVSEALMPYCLTYGRVLAFFLPFQTLAMAFHPLLITAEKSGLGLAATIVNAVVNILLDWLFVAGFGWGMRGAAVATGLAWMVSAAIPICWFVNREHSLHFARPLREIGALGQTLYNGASEMVDGAAYAIVALIFNLRLLKYFGEEGVGAYAVSGYVSGVFASVLYGIGMSIVPVVGYHLGKRDRKELHNLRRSGMLLMGILGIAMTGLCLGLADPVSRLFVGYNEALTGMAVRALRLISLSYLLGGITIYSSSYFTGLNLGSASLLIAAVKGLAGPLAAMFLLPVLFGADGLWASTPAAEVLALVTALGCFRWLKKNADKVLQKTI